MSPATAQVASVVELKPGDTQPADITERSLRMRIRQQEILAELGSSPSRAPSLSLCLTIPRADGRGAGCEVQQSVGIHPG